MYDGAVHENLAEPRIQNVTLQQESGNPTTTPVPCLRLGCPPVGSSRPKKSWFATPAIEWRTAQTLFEQSLKIDPNLSEAEIRLACVLALQDQHEAAIAHLKQVLRGSALPQRLRYFSLLFLGREQRTLERPAEAETAYREAAALYPGAQWPQLGLSQVAHHRGDRERALAHLAILKAPPASDDRADPWSTYNRVHVPDAVELMTTLIKRLSK